MRRMIKNVTFIFTTLGLQLLVGNQLFANTLAGEQTPSKLIAEQLYTPLPEAVIPELASQGKYTVGVKTLKVINQKQFNPVTQEASDRPLTLEIWYPAFIPNKKEKTTYENETRSGIPFSIQANAYRDANILIGDKGNKFPLVVISHGYTGYRSLMFYLGEHLASHGYIVAAIDHTDSTNAEVDMAKAPFAGFFSTLLNRSRDQQFTLDYLTTNEHFASKVIDTNNAGLVGYSMGGYGAVNTIGGCYNFNEQTAAMFTDTKNPEKFKQAMSLLNSCAGGQYKDVKVSDKWKSVVAISPWGGQLNLFKDDNLATITTPILYVAGDLDDISGYDGIKSIFNKTGSNSKFLLTYENARHNIAPHPAPHVAKTSELDIGHYYEPVWGSMRLNNINKHFTLAMMDCYIKADKDKCAYLELSGSSNQLSENGKVPEPWKGFDHRYSTGMSWLGNASD